MSGKNLDYPRDASLFAEINMPRAQESELPNLLWDTFLLLWPKSFVDILRYGTEFRLATAHPEQTENKPSDTFQHTPRCRDKVETSCSEVLATFLTFLKGSDKGLYGLSTDRYHHLRPHLFCSATELSIALTAAVCKHVVLPSLLCIDDILWRYVGVNSARVQNHSKPAREGIYSDALVVSTRGSCPILVAIFPYLQRGSKKSPSEAIQGLINCVLPYMDSNPLVVADAGYGNLNLACALSRNSPPVRFIFSMPMNGFEQHHRACTTGVPYNHHRVITFKHKGVTLAASFSNETQKQDKRKRVALTNCFARLSPPEPLPPGACIDIIKHCLLMPPEGLSLLLSTHSEEQTMSGHRVLRVAKVLQASTGDALCAVLQLMSSHFVLNKKEMVDKHTNQDCFYCSTRDPDPNIWKGCGCGRWFCRDCLGGTKPPKGLNTLWCKECTLELSEKKETINGYRELLCNLKAGSSPLAVCDEKILHYTSKDELLAFAALLNIPVKPKSKHATLVQRIVAEGKSRIAGRSAELAESRGQTRMEVEGKSFRGSCPINTAYASHFKYVDFADLDHHFIWPGTHVHGGNERAHVLHILAQHVVNVFNIYLGRVHRRGNKLPFETLKQMLHSQVPPLLAKMSDKEIWYQ